PGFAYPAGTRFGACPLVERRRARRLPWGYCRFRTDGRTVEIYLPIADLPVNIFVILAMGLAVGFISGMFGIGGGFLMTPLLIFLGITPAVAVASVTGHIAASSCSGAISYWRRRTIDVALVCMLLGGGILGTAFGVWLFTTLRALGQLDLTIGVSYVLLLGIVGAVMGIGGGFLPVPMLIYLLRVPTATVIGTSMVLTLVTMLCATVMHAATNHLVDALLALILMVGGVTGAQFGARAGQKISGEWLRLLLGILVLAVGIRFMLDLALRPDDLYSLRTLEGE